ncbi:PREDICTED: U4/U6 small nuclear ribonucleoprotein Prp3-like [Populus euphratica]|uniref:U4/U6 small nuclear ribonucleoprotein Prp3-like n=1 Tax=Populus euphratica TaxID=75702 RepID=A0AAJ6XHU6_POPEU|nr:PREDICTED: U4/U6 small nuclear ribonucleoprotein Prp3-like [Populus euphratica]XP_011019435.1 PREDICTED: U4/U6 small nuclear ribonucleoprotein Prp3-like [Populus euphratica]XP_011019523.1 PREDICTED: U4/U6 small nuclear ribonucleoprotein Prp3-like [Populus euphratica]
MDRSFKHTRDDRDRDHHKHRSRDDKHRDSSDSHHHRSERESHQREHHKSSRRDDTKRERSHEREESVDRRERSHDHKSSSSSRREERERSYDAREEREGSRERKREKRERETVDEDYSERKKRKERGGGEDRAVAEKEKRSRRRFGEKLKEEDNRTGNNDNGNSFENVKRVDSSEAGVKEEVNDEPIGGGRGSATENGGVSTTDGASLESLTKTPGNQPETSVAAVHPLPTKVSSISNTNENKGVSIARSHEVPGKSSTDGTSSAAGKSGNLSLDALAKAKKALQMQKELSEKLKKLPLSSKGNNTSSGGSSQRVLPSATTTTAVSTGAVCSSYSLSTSTMVSIKTPSTGVAPLPDITSMPNYEAVKRAQELAAKMGFRQDPEFAPLINLFPGQLPAEVSVPQKPTKTPVLRVDALGREIDEHGNVVNVTKPSNLSTLKVNINKQKKEAFQILKPELDVDPESNPYYDVKMGINKNKFLRPKRMTFQFVEEGKWLKEAEIMKLRNQFGEEREKDMKARQALHAKAKAAPDINPNLIEVSERFTTKAKPKDPIPDVEWWDAPLLTDGTYGENDVLITEHRLKRDKITIYVQHPRPIDPPAEPAPPPPQPLKLTKKEQKKLRTQRRLAREKDRQEMIRQGLIEPPKPKVKMSNLMKVLGSEATQDPTRLEKQIRTAAAEREQAHIDRNTARKLTPAERREKKERKLFDDPNTMETIVSVYRINNLSDKKTRFKVDVNAHENRLTGCTVITEGICVVVVEGGSKSIKRYGKLMLRRINWAEAVNKDEGDDNEEKPVNKCMLVWQGSVAKPSFHRFSLHDCVTEAAARKYFADAGVAHYWDLAVNFSDDQM